MRGELRDLTPGLTHRSGRGAPWRCHAQKHPSDAPEKVSIFKNAEEMSSSTGEERQLLDLLYRVQSSLDDQRVDLHTDRRHRPSDADTVRTRTLHPRGMPPHAAPLTDASDAGMNGACGHAQAHRRELAKRHIEEAYGGTRGGTKAGNAGPGAASAGPGATTTLSADGAASLAALPSPRTPTAAVCVEAQGAFVRANGTVLVPRAARSLTRVQHGA